MTLGKYALVLVSPKIEDPSETLEPVFISKKIALDGMCFR